MPNNQELLIQSIINSLKKIPNLNEMKSTIDDMSTSCVAMTGATEESDGTSGLVPQPLKTDYDKFLCGDGTWKKVNTNLDDIDTSISLELREDAPSLNNTYLMMDSGTKVGKTNTLYKSSTVRFLKSNLNNDDRTVLLALGRQDLVDPLNTGITLTRGTHIANILPSLNLSSDTTFRLPDVGENNDVELLTALSLEDYYNKDKSDSQYLNKTIVDTAVGLMIEGEEGLSVKNLDNDSKIQLSYNQTTKTFDLQVSKLLGTQNEFPSTLSVDNTGYCKVNGSCSNAEADKDGNKIDTTYAKLNNDVSFKSVKINGCTLSSSGSYIATSHVMTTRIALSNQSSFVFRNTAAGTAVNPPSNSYSGSIYLQYT